jgi:hypothetical protein
MTAWYYSKGGQQNGPVSTDEILRLFGTGSIGPRDLVWREGMVDWKPAGEVPELAFQPPPPPVAVIAAPVSSAVDPYRPPSASWNDLAVSPPTGDEIVPGSEPLEIGPCISRSWELVKRHFGLLIAVWVIYFVVSVGFSILAELPVVATQGGADSVEVAYPSDAVRAYNFITRIAEQILDVFLGLGLVRIGLNIVSNKPADISMLFGEGRKLISMILASILYGFMVFGGLLLLVVPGIYLALRFGQYQYAIVDKDLGAIEALKYSSKITQGNLLNLFGLIIVCILVVLAGVLALVVGLIVAIPITHLATLVAYRWLQYGRASLRG